MKHFNLEKFENLRGLLVPEQPEPLEQAERIVKVLRDIVLPAKAGLCLVVLYYLFYSGWLAEEQPTQSVTLDTLKNYFEIYLLANFVGAVLLFSWRRLPPGLPQWLAFILGLLDGIFMAGIAVVTGGFTSNAFWVFPGLIMLNALSIPLATPQIVLNLLLSVFYAAAVLFTPSIGWDMPLPDSQILANMYASHAVRQGTTNLVSGGSVLLPRARAQRAEVPFPLGPFGAARHGSNTLAKLNNSVWNSTRNNTDPGDEVVPEQLLLRVSVLWLLTLCCYGAQLLLERQRAALMEAAEFAAREAQLHSAGRLAAEFAHQIKNPLAIINNAAFTLKRSGCGARGSAATQIEIIQEEVARVDKVITQIMGYAKLNEGRVEKLKLGEQIERAVEQVFPPGMPSDIKLKKKLYGELPPLLMQRGHLAEILVNLLLNAREALGGPGNVSIVARCNPQYAVEIMVADDGPGIPPDKIGRIFEAYFTTKEKGTGLGLAIVKHNAELYGGAVRVESGLGQGAKFTVILPLKSQPKPFIQ
jgi:nitrogen-specific signal transduction histidine kinase